MLRRTARAGLLILSLWLSACAGPGGASPTPARQAASTPEPRTATLSELRAQVEAREAAEAGWRPASEGQTVRAGGGARTGEESRLRIDISDGTILRIAPNSLFELRELSPESTDPRTTLFLEAGQVFVWVTRALGGGSFGIETPVGSATVRGSLISVAYDPATGRMTVTCLEGLCRLAEISGAFSDLAAGQQSEIAGPAAAPSAAQQIDDAQLALWAREFPEAQSALATVTALPRASATPSITPTPSPTPTPAPQSACDHAYLPLREGASWSYRRTAAEGPRRVTTQTVAAVRGDLQNATAEVSGDWVYECGPEGIRLSAPLTFSGTVNNLEGVYLPPAEQLVIGYSWSYAYETVTPLVPSGTWTVTNHLTHTVAGMDPVEIAGHTYEGLQVAVTLVLTQRGLPLGDPGPAEYSYMVEWARGVGLVDGRAGRLESFVVP